MAEEESGSGAHLEQAPQDSNMYIVSPHPDGEALVAEYNQQAVDGLLQVAALPPLLQQTMHLDVTSQQVGDALLHLGITSPGQRINLEETLVLCQVLSGRNSPLAGGGQASFMLSRGGSVGALKKNLSQRRAAYLTTGQLSTDAAVLAYMQRLEEHRKMCELTGRYAEARAAAQRLQGLRTAQAERLRAELIETQYTELQHVQDAYHKDCESADKEWSERTHAYEAAVVGQLAALTAGHGAQMAAAKAEADMKRPGRIKPSSEYLSQRRVEEKLVKQGQYRAAHEVARGAEQLFQADLAAAQAASEAAWALKAGRLAAKQQAELEVLLQRAGQGRDELELRRLEEQGRRAARFRVVAAELDQLHRLEVAHLEHFLEGQVVAGHYVPLRDSSYRRKRETAMAQQLRGG